MNFLKSEGYYEYCAGCEYEEICDEVAELRKMRKTKEKGRHLDA